MEFRILGPLEVLSAGQALDLGGRSNGPCWRCCSCARTRSSPRVDSSRHSGRTSLRRRPSKALQVYIWQLRKLLGKERLQDEGAGYSLTWARESSTSTRFQRLQHGGSTRTRRCPFGEGPPLAEFSSQRFAQREIARHGGAAPRLPGGSDRVRIWTPAAMRSSSASWKRSSPSTRFRERLRAQLMLALYRSRSPGRGARDLPERHGGC